MESQVHFTPEAPLPNDIQKQLDLAQNRISLLENDVRRLTTFKMELEAACASLTEEKEDKQAKVDELDVRSKELQEKNKGLQEDNVQKESEKAEKEADIIQKTSDLNQVGAALEVAKTAQFDAEAETKRALEEGNVQKAQAESLKQKMLQATVVIRDLISQF